MDRSPGPMTTAESIVQAARQAISKGGRERLTMAKVARTAGISRPTLYRWFPTKTELMAAITVYEENQFDIGLQLVLEAHRSPRRRLDAALRYLVRYLDDSIMPDSIAADPDFALESLGKSLEPHVVILARSLGEALDQVPAVWSGVLTRDEAAEVFLRLAYSHYLVPHPKADVLLGMVRGLAGLVRQRSRAPVQT